MYDDFDMSDEQREKLSQLEADNLRLGAIRYEVRDAALRERQKGRRRIFHLCVGIIVVVFFYFVSRFMDMGSVYKSQNLWFSKTSDDKVSSPTSVTFSELAITAQFPAMASVFGLAMGWKGLLNSSQCRFVLLSMLYFTDLEGVDVPACVSAASSGSATSSSCIQLARFLSFQRKNLCGGKGDLNHDDMPSFFGLGVDDSDALKLYAAWSDEKNPWRGLLIAPAGQAADRILSYLLANPVYVEGREKVKVAKTKEEALLSLKGTAADSLFSGGLVGMAMDHMGKEGDPIKETMDLIGADADFLFQKSPSCTAQRIGDATSMGMFAGSTSAILHQVQLKGGELGGKALLFHAAFALVAGAASYATNKGC